MSLSYLWARRKRFGRALLFSVGVLALLPIAACGRKPRSVDPPPGHVEYVYPPPVKER